MASELPLDQVPDVKAARRALIEYFTGNPDDEFDGPCSVVDAYAAAVRGEAWSCLQSQTFAESFRGAPAATRDAATSLLPR